MPKSKENDPLSVKGGHNLIWPASEGPRGEKCNIRTGQKGSIMVLIET
jgi:hypothetical protein